MPSEKIQINDSSHRFEEKNVNRLLMLETQTEILSALENIKNSVFFLKF